MQRRRYQIRSAGCARDPIGVAYGRHVLPKLTLANPTLSRRIHGMKLPSWPSSALLYACGRGRLLNMRSHPNNRGHPGRSFERFAGEVPMNCRGVLSHGAA
jgi:hypothetical protein